MNTQQETPMQSATVAQAPSVALVYDGRSLYKRYPTQTTLQPCFVELDCKRSELDARYNAEIGNAVPVDVWYGHLQRFKIELLKPEAIAKLLADIAPFAAVVVAGYTSAWDGHNHRARFTSEAQKAIEQIERLCEYASGDERALEQRWDADAWYQSETHEQRVKRLGITAHTTDEQIDEMVAGEVDLASQDGILLDREHIEACLRGDRTDVRLDADPISSYRVRLAKHPEFSTCARGPDRDGAVEECELLSRVFGVPGHEVELDEYKSYWMPKNSGRVEEFEHKFVITWE